MCYVMIISLDQFWIIFITSSEHKDQLKRFGTHIEILDDELAKPRVLIWDAMRDMIPFTQFKKTWKTRVEEC